MALKRQEMPTPKRLTQKITTKGRLRTTLLDATQRGESGLLVQFGIAKNRHSLDRRVRNKKKLLNIAEQQGKNMHPRVPKKPRRNGLIFEKPDSIVFGLIFFDNALSL